MTHVKPMGAALRAVVAAALQRCAARGATLEAIELAYAACMLEEAGGWGQDGLSLHLAVTSVTENSLTVASGKPKSPALAGDVVSALAERLVHSALAPLDAAAAATARLQLAAERARSVEQAAADARRAQHAAAVERLASSLAQRRVSAASAGLREYQAVLDDVVAYACEVVGVNVCCGGSGAAFARPAVAAAVESVMPLSSAAHFLSLPSAMRLQQLGELGRVVCGICCFDARARNGRGSACAGGASTAAAAALDPAAASSQLPPAARLLERIRHSAAEAAAAMAACDDAVLEERNSSDGGDPDVGAGAGVRSCSDGGSGLGRALFSCQAAVLLRELAGELAAALRLCQRLEAGAQDALSRAAALVAGSGARGVPKADVLPLFETAGRLHLALREEVQQLLMCERLYEHACHALDEAAAVVPPAVPRVLGIRTARSSSGQAGAVSGGAGGKGGLQQLLAAELQAAGLQYLPPPCTGDAPDVADGDGDGSTSTSAGGDLCTSTCEAVALGGLCAASLAGSVAAGGDIPVGCLPGAAVARLADPSVGQLRYKGALFGFCSADALRCFAAAPEAALEGVRRAVRRQPLLANLLHVSSPLAHQSSSSSSSSRGSGSNGVKDVLPGAAVAVPPLQQLAALLDDAPLHVDAGVQTATHAEDGHWDWQYEWNEWAMRRRVIALANLRRKATHGAQTLLSHFRCEGGSQTWLPKVASSQTPVHKSSTMPRRLQYVCGVRGPPAAGRARVVSLELDIGQTLQH